MPIENPYEELFARHRSVAIPSLWGWQSEVLRACAGVSGDAAVEIPTGSGKTLIGLASGEHHRDTKGRPVAYVAGNKRLAQQGERQACELGFSVVRFQGPGVHASLYLDLIEKAIRTGLKVHHLGARWAA
jgi:superfamily II DNA or RNA helicase